jgi:microsomal prostaglandin-E synthase 1
MNDLLGNEAFVAYAIATLFLVANILFLWGWSGTVRSKTSKAVNEEDAALFKVSLDPVDPPEVARVLRAHANAQASIYPFLFLGIVFVLAAGDATFGRVLFSIFVIARICHSVAYLKGKQPWRTLFFTVGGLTTLVLMGDIVWLLVKGR